MDGSNPSQIRIRVRDGFKFKSGTDSSPSQGRAAPGGCRERQLEEALRGPLARADQLRRRPEAVAAARERAAGLLATLGRLAAERPWISRETLGRAREAVAGLQRWCAATL